MLAGDPAPIVTLTIKRPGEPVLPIGENLKLEGLGWQPRYSLAKSLERTSSGLSQYPQQDKVNRTS